MRPADGDLDDELRGHLAISIRERVDRGEDPASARLAAMRDGGLGRRGHAGARRPAAEDRRLDDAMPSSRSA
jgi:hypothetical protein